MITRSCAEKTYQWHSATSAKRHHNVSKMLTELYASRTSLDSVLQRASGFPQSAERERCFHGSSRVSEAKEAFEDENNVEGDCLRKATELFTVQELLVLCFLPPALIISFLTLFYCTLKWVLHFSTVRQTY